MNNPYKKNSTIVAIRHILDEVCARFLKKLVIGKSTKIQDRKNFYLLIYKKKQHDRRYSPYFSLSVHTFFEKARNREVYEIPQNMNVEI